MRCVSGRPFPARVNSSRRDRSFHRQQATLRHRMGGATIPVHEPADSKLAASSLSVPLAASSKCFRAQGVCPSAAACARHPVKCRRRCALGAGAHGILALVSGRRPTLHVRSLVCQRQPLRFNPPTSHWFRNWCSYSSWKDTSHSRHFTRRTRPSSRLRCVAPTQDQIDGMLAPCDFTTPPSGHRCLSNRLPITLFPIGRATIEKTGGDPPICA